MRNRLISLACWIGALAITLAASVGSSYFGFFEVFALASVVWAVIDSKRVRLQRFYTALSGPPLVVLCLLMLFGWPIVFPWYLGTRFKIMAGVARLREEHQPWSMSDQKVAPSGLVQPWRGRKI
jgi:hypothetical protein